MRILITGASGNVGSATLRHLDRERHQVFVAGRDPERLSQTLGLDPDACLLLDFSSGAGIETLPDFDSVFLLRPPTLPRENRFIEPFVRSLRPGTRVVFLSLQGAENMRFIPHRRIEQAIAATGLPHVFVRPSYFMENLITALWPELRDRRRIYLPAGNKRNNWIAVDDIGAATAHILEKGYESDAITLTGDRNMGFAEVVQTINRRFGLDLHYESANVLRFSAHELRGGTHPIYLLVLLLINWVSRFEAEAQISDDFERLMGRATTPLESWLDSRSDWFERLRADQPENN